MAPRVLVIEDEPEMKMILHDNLRFEGYEVVSADTGEEGYEIALRTRPDLLLLDIMLPRMTGYEVCRRLRSSGCEMPIIMITARNAEMDRLVGFELGATDYVGKPFSVRELLARVRVQLHGCERRSNQFAFGDIVVDLERRIVRRGSETIEMSSREFDLLHYLIGHRGAAVTREQLLADVWGYSHLSLTRTVDNFVVKLRRRIDPGPAEPRHILTVHGVGYRFMP